MQTFKVLFSNKHAAAKGLVLLLGFAGAVTFQVQEYPFSDYSMYADLFEPEEFIYWSLKVVDEAGREENLNVQNAIFPFTEGALVQALVAHYDQSPERLEEILRDLLELYNNRRPNHTKYEIRLYRVYYDWRDFKKSLSPPYQQIEVQPKRSEVLWRVALKP